MDNFSKFVTRKEKLSRVFEAMAYTIAETSQNTLVLSTRMKKIQRLMKIDYTGKFIIILMQNVLPLF